MAGLPLVINHHPVEPIPDLEGDWIVLCDNTPEGYRAAIEALAGSEAMRADYGQRALNHARENFWSENMTRKTVALYREVMGRGG